MDSVTIKGVITPYTPKRRDKALLYAKFPELAFLRNKYLENGDTNWNRFEVRINNRVCAALAHDKYVYVYPVDDALPPKKLLISEKRANEDYMIFCQTGDWQDLSGEMEFERLKTAVIAILNNQFDPDRASKIVGLILSEREKKAHPPTT